MKKNIFVLSISLGLLLSFTINTAVAQDEYHGLSVSIAVPSHHDNRVIDLHSPSAHFHVQISNKSKYAVNLWREWCSWGYFNLSFEVTNDAGKTWIVKKKDRPWTKNFPDFITLGSNQSIIYNVDFDPKFWESSPLLNSARSQKLIVRAIYESKESGDAKKNGVWSGKITSQARKYMVKH